MGRNLKFLNETDMIQHSTSLQPNMASISDPRLLLPSSSSTSSSSSSSSSPSSTSSSASTLNFINDEPSPNLSSQYLDSQPSISDQNINKDQPISCSDILPTPPIAAASTITSLLSSYSLNSSNPSCAVVSEPVIPEFHLTTSYSPESSSTVSSFSAKNDNDNANNNNNDDDDGDIIDNTSCNNCDTNTLSSDSSSSSSSLTLDLIVDKPKDVVENTSVASPISFDPLSSFYLPVPTTATSPSSLSPTVKTLPNRFHSSEIVAPTPTESRPNHSHAMESEIKVVGDQAQPQEVIQSDSIGTDVDDADQVAAQVYAEEQVRNVMESFIHISECEYRSKQLGSIADAGDFPCNCSYEYGKDHVTTACGEGSGCINRQLFIECQVDHCPCGEHCQNRRFQHHEYASIEVMLTKEKGFGLRTLVDLKPNTFVIEYVGEVIPKAVFLHRAKQYHLEGNDHFYFMSLQKDEVIDAQRKGCVARFVNHSCNPNCATQKWIVGNKLRIGLFTLHDIPAGTELTFDYKFERYGEEAQVCKCGESNCTGFIGTSSNKRTTEELGNLSFDESFDEVSYFQAISTKKKKTKLYPIPRHEIMNAIKLLVHEAHLRDAVIARLLISDDDDLKFLMRQQIFFISRFMLFETCFKYQESLKSGADSAAFVYTIIQILKLLKILPVKVRNPIEKSNILEVIETKCVPIENNEVTMLCEDLKQSWESLSGMYKIPKKSEIALKLPSPSVAAASSPKSLPLIEKCEVAKSPSISNESSMTTLTSPALSSSSSYNIDSRHNEQRSAKLYNSQGSPQKSKNIEHNSFLFTPDVRAHRKAGMRSRTPPHFPRYTRDPLRFHEESAPSSYYSGKGRNTPKRSEEGVTVHYGNNDSGEVSTRKRPASPGKLLKNKYARLRGGGPAPSPNSYYPPPPDSHAQAPYSRERPLFSSPKKKAPLENGMEFCLPCVMPQGHPFTLAYPNAPMQRQLPQIASSSRSSPSHAIKFPNATSVPRFPQANVALSVQRDENANLPRNFSPIKKFQSTGPSMEQIIAFDEQLVKGHLERERQAKMNDAKEAAKKHTTRPPRTKTAASAISHALPTATSSSRCPPQALVKYVVDLISREKDSFGGKDAFKQYAKKLTHTIFEKDPHIVRNNELSDRAKDNIKKFIKNSFRKLKMASAHNEHSAKLGFSKERPTLFSLPASSSSVVVVQETVDAAPTTKWEYNPATAPAPTSVHEEVSSNPWASTSISGAAFAMRMASCVVGTCGATVSETGVSTVPQVGSNIRDRSFNTDTMSESASIQMDEADVSYAAWGSSADPLPLETSHFARDTWNVSALSSQEPECNTPAPWTNDSTVNAWNDSTPWDDDMESESFNPACDILSESGTDDVKMTVDPQVESSTSANACEFSAPWNNDTSAHECSTTASSRNVVGPEPSNSSAPWNTGAELKNPSTAASWVENVEAEDINSANHFFGLAGPDDFDNMDHDQEERNPTANAWNSSAPWNNDTPANQWVAPASSSSVTGPEDLNSAAPWGNDTEPENLRSAAPWDERMEAEDLDSDFDEINVPGRDAFEGIDADQGELSSATETWDPSAPSNTETPESERDQDFPWRHDTAADDLQISPSSYPESAKNDVDPSPRLNNDDASSSCDPPSTPMDVETSDDLSSSENECMMKTDAQDLEILDLPCCSPKDPEPHSQCKHSSTPKPVPHDASLTDLQYAIMSSPSFTRPATTRPPVPEFVISSSGPTVVEGINGQTIDLDQLVRDFIAPMEIKNHIPSLPIDPREGQRNPIPTTTGTTSDGVDTTVPPPLAQQSLQSPVEPSALGPSAPANIPSKNFLGYPPIHVHLAPATQSPPASSSNAMGDSSTPTSALEPEAKSVESNVRTAAEPSTVESVPSSPRLLAEACTQTTTGVSIPEPIVVTVKLVAEPIANAPTHLVTVAPVISTPSSPVVYITQPSTPVASVSITPLTGQLLVAPSTREPLPVSTEQQGVNSHGKVLAERSTLISEPLFMEPPASTESALVELPAQSSGAECAKLQDAASVHEPLMVRFGQTSEPDFQTPQEIDCFEERLDELPTQASAPSFIEAQEIPLSGEPLVELPIQTSAPATLEPQVVASNGEQSLERPTPSSVPVFVASYATTPTVSLLIESPTQSPASELAEPRGNGIKVASMIDPLTNVPAVEYVGPYFAASTGLSLAESPPQPSAQVFAQPQVALSTISSLVEPTQTWIPAPIEPSVASIAPSLNMAPFQPRSLPPNMNSAISTVQSLVDTHAHVSTSYPVYSPRQGQDQYSDQSSIHHASKFSFHHSNQSPLHSPIYSATPSIGAQCDSPTESWRLPLSKYPASSRTFHTHNSVQPPHPSPQRTHYSAYTHRESLHVSPLSPTLPSIHHPVYPPLATPSSSSADPARFPREGPVISQGPTLNPISRPSLLGSYKRQRTLSDDGSLSPSPTPSTPDSRSSEAFSLEPSSCLQSMELAIPSFLESNPLPRPSLIGSYKRQKQEDGSPSPSTTPFTHESITNFIPHESTAATSRLSPILSPREPQEPSPQQSTMVVLPPALLAALSGYRGLSESPIPSAPYSRHSSAHSLSDSSSRCTTESLVNYPPDSLIASLQRKPNHRSRHSAGSPFSTDGSTHPSHGEHVEPPYDSSRAPSTKPPSPSPGPSQIAYSHLSTCQDISSRSLTPYSAYMDEEDGPYYVPTSPHLRHTAPSLTPCAVGPLVDASTDASPVHTSH